MLEFAEFVADLPQLHSWDNGVTWNTGGFERAHLERLRGFFADRLPAQPAILETGAGNSTIFFLLAQPARLISISPEQSLFDRIVSYCNAHGIATDALDMQVGFSERVLPGLAACTADPGLDFALIDGGHGWPTVFVDFAYANAMLRKGGCLMVDDVQLHSVKELARLLAEQPGFALALDLGKSLLFRKTTDARWLGEWNSQPYIARRTADYARGENPFALRAGEVRAGCVAVQ